MAEKSRDAFRTISEVADWLDVPTHVLRFWESRFSQIKPVKRAGGRRYYRPSDMRVIGGVKVLLHDQGMTIRGVQKLFREEGIKHVSGYAPRLFDEDEETPKPRLDEEALVEAAKPASAARSTHDAAPDPEPEDVTAPEPSEEAEPAVVFRRSSRPGSEIPAADAPAEVAEASPTEEPPVAAPPSVPATPDVPESDPADDEPAYAADPGVAARIKLIPEVTLIANKALLADAADRLRAVADRAG